MNAVEILTKMSDNYLLECMQKRLVLKMSIKNLVDDATVSGSEAACKHHPFGKSLAWKC